MRFPTVASRPVLRVVTTSRCNLRCHYCPPDNEDFPSAVVGKGGPRDIDWTKLRQFLEIAFQTGIYRVSFTGGEPLLTSGPVDLLADYAKQEMDREWVLQTNGMHLRKFLPQLRLIKSLTLKISLDVFNREAFKEMCGFDGFDEVVAAIRDARQCGIAVGINVVLTKGSVPYIRDLVAFARETGSYVKFLDLNWYVDVGSRRSFFPVSDSYWKIQYVSPSKELLPVLRTEHIDGFEERRNHRYGIPVLDSSAHGSFFVRVKDSSRGTTYAPLCRGCQHFTSRKCQEGVYELTLTPDFRLKICRHRPDLEYHVDPAAHSTAQIRQTLLDIFANVYEQAQHHEIPETVTCAYTK